MTKLINQTREGYIPVPGGRIWYEINGAGQGNIPLVVLQGGPGMPHGYMQPLEILADERPVIFYDQLGAGKADKPTDPFLWTVERYVEELTLVWQGLKLEQAHIIGHSWGGMLATDYALTKPRGLVSLILDNSPLSIPCRVRDVATCRAALPDDVKAVLDKHETAGTTNSEEYQAAAMLFYQRHYCRLSPWPDVFVNGFAEVNQDVMNTMCGPSEFTYSGNLKDYDRTGRLHEIVVPTLFLSGRYGLVPPHTSAWFQSLLPGSGLVVFEESAELLFLEEPEHYFQVVRDFLRRSESRQSTTTT